MYPALAVLLALGASGLTLGWRSARTREPGGAGSRQAHDAFLGTTYFKGLDGLRALSVVAVLWCHLTGPHTLELLNRGNQGVQLFFAISGFLVTTLLLRERRRTGAISLRDFYLRRTLRIFPLYYAVLAIYVVLVFATMRGTPKATEFWHNLPAFATYTSNWFVSGDNASQHGVTFYFAWSLATEEQFYLFWPPLLVWALAAGRRAWMPALAATALLILQVLANQAMAGPTGLGAPETGLAVMALASLAPPILLGAVLAVLLDCRPSFDVLAPALGHPASAPLLALSLLLGLQANVTGLVTGLTMALLVASVCLRQDSLLHRALDLQPVAFVGSISYGIYLMHMLAANAIRRLLGEQMGFDVFLGTLVVAIALAAISHRWFEVPILRLKSRIAAPRKQATAPLPGQLPAS